MIKRVHNEDTWNSFCSCLRDVSTDTTFLRCVVWIDISDFYSKQLSPCILSWIGVDRKTNCVWNSGTILLFCYLWFRLDLQAWFPLPDSLAVSNDLPRNFVVSVSWTIRLSLSWTCLTLTILPSSEVFTHISVYSEWTCKADFAKLQKSLASLRIRDYRYMSCWVRSIRLQFEALLGLVQELRPTHRHTLTDFESDDLFNESGKSYFRESWTWWQRLVLVSRSTLIPWLGIANLTLLTRFYFLIPDYTFWESG